MLLIPKRHGQTDGQTDGRLTVALPRSALASRGKNVPPTSRRCTLNRTYRERNSAVRCGTVQCTFSCSLLRRISPYSLFYYENEVIIVFGGQDLGGLCPPGPSLKPPLFRTSHLHCRQSSGSISRYFPSARHTYLTCYIVAKILFSPH